MISRDCPLPCADSLQALLQQRLGEHLHVRWHAVTGSTNADAAMLLRDASMPDCLVGAHHQTAGRGRRGRRWDDAPGTVLMMSLGTRRKLDPRHLASLSLMSGVVACETLERFLPPENRSRLNVKWPNDLLWDDAKLAGLLVESSLAADGVVHLVIGMGMNLSHAQARSATLGRSVADWQQTGGSMALPELIEALAQAWREALALHVTHGAAPFVQRLAQRDALLGRPVRLSNEAGILAEGVARGCSTEGLLQIETPQGMSTWSIGEVSVRLEDAP